MLNNLGRDVDMIGFLDEPAETDAARRLFDEDLADLGYVMNASRLWAYQPDVLSGLFDLMRATVTPVGLTFRQRGVLVAACASTFGDSYCSLAWGGKLAGVTDESTAAGVLTGDDSRLTPAEQVMAAWARAVVRDPNGTSAADVGALRTAGFSDAEIFAITVFVALRVALSTVNDALGAIPDVELRTGAPSAVRAAVTFGRSPEAPA
jgi:hypothetical protein